MAHITQVIVTVKTGNESGADADGSVYLGLGPREFRLDKKGNQFEKGGKDEFILGNTGPGGQANVKNPNENDPTTPIRIELQDLLGVPFSGMPPSSSNPWPYNVYIAYEGDNKWLVEDVKVRVIGDPSVSSPDFDVTFTVLNGINSPGIWLGKEFGKFLYLQPQ
jgi:hypothetical protein